MADKRRKLEWVPKDPEIKKCLQHILVRLPLNYLARMKLMRKDWRDLIQSPDFLSAHRNHSQSKILVQESLFLPRGPKELRPFKSAIHFVCSCGILIGSINGLICMAGNYFNNLTSPNDIWILNPVTGNARKLPLPACPVDISGYERVRFAFWWDSNIGGYKVFKIVSRSSRNHSKAWESSFGSGSLFSYPVDSNRAEVWDSRRPDRWGEISIDFNRPFYFPYQCVSYSDVIVGVFAYWIVVDGNGECCFVLSLNMETHALKYIPLPNLSIPIDTVLENLTCPINPRFFGGNWKGNFALIEKERACGGTQYYTVYVWRLDVSGAGAWGERLCFHLDYCIRRSINNNINETLLLEREDRVIIFYNTKTQKSEVLGSKGLYELETPEEDKMAIVDYEQFSHWMSLEAKGNPMSFKKHQNYMGFFDDMKSGEDDMKSGEGEAMDCDLVYTCIISAHDFVGSLVSIDGFQPIKDFHDNDPIYPGFLFIWPNGSVGSGNTDDGINEQAEAEKKDCGNTDDGINEQAEAEKKDCGNTNEVEAEEEEDYSCWGVAAAEEVDFSWI